MRFSIVLMIFCLSCQNGEQNASSETLNWSIPKISEDDLIVKLSVAMLSAEQDSFDRNQLLDFIVHRGWDMSFDDAGYFYYILENGKDPRPAWGDKVTVHYNGYLLDGHRFDSSWSRGKPFSFYVGNVISGWNKALTHLGIEGRGVFLIPSNLAYGSAGFKDLVPPDEHLLFEIQLLAIEPN